MGNRMKRKIIFWSNYMNFSRNKKIYKCNIFGWPGENKALWTKM